MSSLLIVNATIALLLLGAIGCTKKPTCPKLAAIQKIKGAKTGTLEIPLDKMTFTLGNFKSSIMVSKQHKLVLTTNKSQQVLMDLKYRGKDPTYLAQIDLVVWKSH